MVDIHTNGRNIKQLIELLNLNLITRQVGRQAGLGWAGGDIGDSIEGWSPVGLGCAAYFNIQHTIEFPHRSVGSTVGRKYGQ